MYTVIALCIFCAGCTEPPVKEPTVSVSDIELSDVTPQSMTVNATVAIFNPNPIGARLNKVVFDVYYLDDIPNYLGHGEQTNIDLIRNGTTTVSIPVTIENIQAIRAAATLVRNGSVILSVNGSAFIDVTATSFEKRFEQSRQFHARDFLSLNPVTTMFGTTVDRTDTCSDSGYCGA